MTSAPIMKRRPAAIFGKDQAQANFVSARRSPSMRRWTAACCCCNGRDRMHAGAHLPIIVPMSIGT